MAAFFNKWAILVLLLATVSVHYGVPAARAQAVATVTRTCPDGWFVQNTHGGPGYYCYPDPCKSDLNTCGPGNACTTIPGIETPVANCTCNAPYLSGTVPQFGPTTTVCYLEGQDVCNPNPCQNGGTCKYVTGAQGQPLVDAQGTKYAFTCDCSNTVNNPSGPRTGPFCNEGYDPAPRITATVNGVTGPLAQDTLDPLCSPTSIPPIACFYNDGVHFICCEGTSDCGPIGPDGNTPVCPGPSYIPVPNNYPVTGTTPPGTPPTPPVSGDQGVCGSSGPAAGFPNRCWYNNDPLGRYICCDSAGCDGFNTDNLSPVCKQNGYAPPFSGNTGVLTPPSNPIGDQGVCGTGPAAPFPTRCYFNNDPLGRYVCCDNQGCNGFNADFLTPHCANSGYVPPNNGLSGPPSPPTTPPTTPPSTPPTGDQGVCGTRESASFPTRCYFNNDPQGRYVCCDNQGCDGFNSDNLTPHCANYGHVPPNFGLSGGPSPPSTPPSTPPSGDQGVCGTSDASVFPTRCWFNSDPLGRYVCCDNQGCDGFNADNLTPHCAHFGYVPPGYGRL